MASKIRTTRTKNLIKKSDNPADPAMQQFFKSWCSFVENKQTEPNKQFEHYSTDNIYCVSDAAAVKFIENNPIHISANNAYCCKSSNTVSSQRAFLDIHLIRSGG